MLKDLFLTPARAMLIEAGRFVSTMAAVVLVLLIGWFIAKLIKNLVIRILDILQIDSYAEKVGIDKILVKGGIKYDISELIGVLSYWLVMLISLVLAISTANLSDQAGAMLGAIILYIPRVISAIFILILGIFAASFVKSAIQTAAANAGIEQANILGRVSQILIVVFAADISLRQTQIDIHGIENAAFIILAALGLALSLAFGLGCKEIAGKATQEFIDKLKSKK